MLRRPRTNHSFVTTLQLICICIEFPACYLIFPYDKFLVCFQGLVPRGKKEKVSHVCLQLYGNSIFKFLTRLYAWLCSLVIEDGDRKQRFLDLQQNYCLTDCSSVIIDCNPQRSRKKPFLYVVQCQPCQHNLVNTENTDNSERKNEK